MRRTSASCSPFRRVYAGGLLLGLCLLGCNRHPAAVKKPAGDQAPAPRLVASQTQADLGELDFAKSYARAFPVSNAGSMPLRLELSRKSCTCTDVEVAPAELGPGQDGQVTLRWTPVPGQAGAHTVAAELTTNDPQQPVLRLEVKGQVNPLVRVWPEDWSEVNFGEIIPEQVQQRELKVFSIKLEDFGLEAGVTPPGLVVTASKLPPDSPVGNLIARSGYLVVLKTTDRLPRGYFKETLRLSVRGDAPRDLTLSVYGVVETGALQVVPSEVEFRQPRLAEGDSRKLQVRFAEPSERESVQVVCCEPSFIRADPPQQIKKGLWQVTLRVPPHDPAAMKSQPDGFFEGRVVLKTSAAAAPEVAVRLKWVPPG